MKDKLRFPGTWTALGVIFFALIGLSLGLAPARAESLEQEFKKSWSYYQKRVKTGAGQKELLEILSKIQTKYRGAKVNFGQVNREFSRLKSSPSNRYADAPVMKRSFGFSKTTDYDAEELEDQEPVASQELIGHLAREIETLEIQRRQVAIADKIRSDVEDVLSEYVDRDAYLVAAQIWLEPVRRGSSSKAGMVPTTAEAEEAGVELPGLPTSRSAAAAALARKAEEASPDWEQLFRMKRQKITVLLQQRRFKADDKRFISNVVRMKSGFNEIRGDQLVIQEMPFPSLARAIAQTNAPLQKEKMEMPPMSFTLTPPPVQPALVPQKVWSWVLGALGLVTLALVWKVIRMGPPMSPQPMFASAPTGSAGTMSFPMGSMSPSAAPAASSAPQAPAVPTPPPPPPMAPQAPRLFEGLRQFVNVTVVGNGELSAEVLRAWWLSGEAGQSQVVTFLRAADPKLLAALGEELGAELSNQIQAGLTQRGIPTTEEAETVFSKFREDYEQVQRVELLRSGTNRDRDLFRFLRKLELPQLAKLFEDEEAGVIAVGLAQLPAEMAGRLLQEFTPEKRIKVPVEMGRLKRIPASALYDIAERLSKKASGVADIRYITTDGVESLIGMLEQLDPETEQLVLSSVQQQDTKLAEEVRKTYLTMVDMANASEKFLTEFLRAVDREVLAKVVASASEEVRTKFLGVLPQRLKVMVEEMAGRFVDLPQKELVEAQKVMLNELRTMLKTGKVSMKQVMGA